MRRLAASIIVAKIKASTTDLPTSVDALIGLGNSGVDLAVIEAMTSAGSAAALPNQPVVAPAPVAVVAGDVSVTRASLASKASDVRTNFKGTPRTTPGISLKSTPSTRRTEAQVGGVFGSMMTCSGKVFAFGIDGAGMASRLLILSAIVLAAGTNGAYGCERYSAPFFRGSGGFAVEPRDGRAAQLIVRPGGETDARTVFGGGTV